MKINGIAYAAVAPDGTIYGTPEGDHISEDKESLKFGMEAWGTPEDAKIVKVRIVLVKDE